MIFVAVNHIEHRVTGDNGRTRGAKVEFYVRTIGAPELSGNCPLVRQAAELAKWGVDETHFFPASGTNIAFRIGSSRLLAKLTILGVQKAQAGIQPAFKRVSRNTHKARIITPAGG